MAREVSKMITQAHTPVTDITWMVTSPFFQNALDKTDNTEWNIIDARNWLDEGKGSLLYASDEEGICYASAIIGISNYHRIKAMEIYLMGSDGESDIQPLFADLIEYAKREGCSRIDVAGRRWIKFLQQFGNARETFRAELEI